LNRRFQTNDEMYFTMIYGVVNVRSGLLRLSQAGHPGPALQRPGADVRILGAGGVPIGMLPAVEYEQLEVMLQRGDRLFLYSDGVTECTNSCSVPFHEKRLIECLKRCESASLAETLASVERDLRAWNGNAEFTDDVSLLALEY